MEKPRVLILGKLPPPVMGPALATEIILGSSLRERYDLHHFDTRINESVADMGRLKPQKIQIIRRKYRAFKTMLASVKPQLVLIPVGQTTAGYFKDIPFIRMAEKSGAKVLIQLRGSAWRSWFNGLGALRRMVVMQSLGRVSGAIVLGDNLRYIFEELIDHDKIFTVPNGADYTFPPPAEASAGENEKTGLRVTYLANYLPGKGILELLLALELIAQKNDLPAFEFNGYGNWDNPAYRAQCEAIAGRLPHVTLHPAVTGADKWQVLANSDIFVFAPTMPEGHPWSIVEAMAAALPIITTDRGAISQSVINHENGYLLDDPHPEMIAGKLTALIKDSALREEMGTKSRAMYEADFTAAAMVRNLGAVFNKILERQCVE